MELDMTKGQPGKADPEIHYSRHYGKFIPTVL